MKFYPTMFKPSPKSAEYIRVFNLGACVESDLVEEIGRIKVVGVSQTLSALCTVAKYPKTSQPAVRPQSAFDQIYHLTD